MRFACSGYLLTLSRGRRFSAQRFSSNSFAAPGIAAQLFARSRHQSQKISLLSFRTGGQPVRLSEKISKQASTLFYKKMSGTEQAGCVCYKIMSGSEQADSLDHERLWRSL